VKIPKNSVQNPVQGSHYLLSQNKALIRCNGCHLSSSQAHCAIRFNKSLAKSLWTFKSPPNLSWHLANPPEELFLTQTPSPTIAPTVLIESQPTNPLLNSNTLDDFKQLLNLTHKFATFTIRKTETLTISYKKTNIDIISNSQPNATLLLLLIAIFSCSQNCYYTFNAPFNTPLQPLLKNHKNNRKIHEPHNSLKTELSNIIKNNDIHFTWSKVSIETPQPHNEPEPFCIDNIIVFPSYTFSPKIHGNWYESPIA
jgi:hypothetical protein